MPEFVQHTHKQFDAEMEALRTGVLTMGGLVETQLARAIQALEQEGDAAAQDDGDAAALDKVGADEQRINQMQIALDEQSSQIIARRQPAAFDLRMILTITKIVNDLERMADEAKKVAYKASRVRGGDQLTQVRHFEAARCARLVREMLQSALDAFARLDTLAATDVVARDEAIDAAFSSILRQLISYMMEDPRTITPALEIVFIAKSIERIGDHAKNIAEAVVQVVKGVDVRHASADRIRAELGDK